MKNIKQIRHKYDVITESKEHEADKLTALVRAGLFEENKLPVVKRALSKEPGNMTIAERKIAMSLLESLMTNFLSQNYEQLNEKADRLTKFDTRFKAGYPEEKDMPVVLILKRKAIRVYPDNQKVALYYSQALDKYVTIPFGPTVGSINEEDRREKTRSPYVIQRTTTKRKEQFISPKHEKSFQDVSSTIKDYEDNLASGKYDTNPAAKSTAQRNLDAARKRLEDINKKKRVTVKASTRNVNLGAIQPKQLTNREYKTLQGAISKDPELNVAHKAAAKFGAFLGRKLGPTGSTRQKVLGSPTVTGAIGKGIAKGAGAVKRVFKEEDTAKYRFRQRLNEKRELQNEVSTPFSVGSRLWKAKDAITGVLSKIRGSEAKPSAPAKPTARPRPRRDRLGRAADAADIAASAVSMSGGGGGSGKDNELGSGPREYGFNLKAQTSRPQFQRTSSVSNPSYDVRTTTAWNQAQQSVREERAFDIVRNMHENNLKESVVNINGNSMKINSLMANKINSLYESLNEENKDKMISLLNESTDSFKKILDFAVRQ